RFGLSLHYANASIFSPVGGAAHCWGAAHRRRPNCGSCRYAGQPPYCSYSTYAGGAAQTQRYTCRHAGRHAAGEPPNSLPNAGASICPAAGSAARQRL
nr:hypothetical protein [Tanacetum cinerariifolium]